MNFLASPEPPACLSPSAEELEGHLVNLGQAADVLAAHSLVTGFSRMHLGEPRSEQYTSAVLGALSPESRQLLYRVIALSLFSLPIQDEGGAFQVFCRAPTSWTWERIRRAVKQINSLAQDDLPFPGE